MIFQSNLVNGSKYENNSVFTTFLDEFDTKADKIDSGYEWKRSLKFLFTIKKANYSDESHYLVRKVHQGLGSWNKWNSWRESNVHLLQKNNYTWFILTYEKSGLPPIEKKLNEIVDMTSLDVRMTIRENIDHFGTMRTNIRNYYSDIYKELFTEPTFREINGFEEAFEKFRKHPIKKKQLRMLVDEQFTEMKRTYRNILERLDEKMNSIPLTRFEFMHQYDLCDTEIREFKKSKDNSGGMIKLNNSIDASIGKLIALETALRDAVLILNEYNIERIKWVETLMNVRIKPQKTSSFKQYFGMN